MKAKQFALILLMTALTACGTYAESPDEDTVTTADSPTAVAETKEEISVTDTVVAAVSETTTADSSETVTMTDSETVSLTEDLSAETDEIIETETETQTETKTEMETETTSVTAAVRKYDFKKGHKVDENIPDIIPYDERTPKDFEYEDLYYSCPATVDIINIEDKEIHDLVQNADFLFNDIHYCSVFKEDESGHLRSTSPNPFTMDFKYDTREETVFLFSTNVSWGSFIDYASSVFTEDCLYRLIYKECRFAEYNGELYRYSGERGIDPAYGSTEFSIYEESDNEITLQRKTIHEIDDYYAETYNYDIKLIKTSEGWRVNNFLTVDDYTWDVCEDGTFYLTDEMAVEDRAMGDERCTMW